MLFNADLRLKCLILVFLLINNANLIIGQGFVSIIESLKTIIPRVSKVSPDGAVNTSINKLVLGSENTEGDSELAGKAFGKLFEVQKRSGGSDKDPDIVSEISSSKATGSDQVSDIQQEGKIDSEDN
ncbi:MAG: hypothetical protein CMM25_07640, partial [Rhodospirillaceae bacterium]|nr:hypothetical protein [Rhodospirillaceae bacterium]